MLTLQPATRPRAGSPAGARSRIGLALAGGGPLGAFYEIGALHALAEAVEGLDLTDLDVYVGVSSGAMVAAALANRIDPLDMGVVFIDNAASEYPMTPSLFLRPAVGEYLRRMASVPGLVLEVARQYARAPFGGAWASVEQLGKLLPTGVFDNQPLERFIANLFGSQGRTNDFRELPNPLYIIATDLDGGSAARFGDTGRDDVPISRAIQASTALPGLYPPVRIRGRTYVDGALMRTMHASVALEHGADLVLCVNPLVAYDAYASGRRSADLETGGFPLVMSQTFRSLIQSRMQVGMAAYRRSHPRADMLLLEPDRSDDAMFFVNVFKYADRRRLVEHCYQRTRADLAAQAARLAPLLERHGLRLRHDVLVDRRRTYQQAVRDRRLHFRPVTGRLHATLDELQDVVASWA